MNYTQEQARQIYQDAQSKGLNPDKVMAELVNRGATIEGIDMVEAVRYSQGSENIGYGQRVKQNVSSNLEQLKADIVGGDGRSNFSRIVSGGAAVARGAVSPLTEAPGVKQVGEVVSKGIDLAGENLAKLYSSDFQKELANMSDEEFSKAIQPLTDIKNAGDIANTLLTARGLAETAKPVTSGIKSTVSGTKSVGRAITDTAGDVFKTFDPQQLSERNFARTFKLSAGDVGKLDEMTGGAVSEWAISNKLIGRTATDTIDNITEFKNKNYNAVRDAVSAVDDIYSFKDVPEARNIVDTLIKDTEGLSSGKYTEVTNQLKSIAEKLNKNEATLSDIQFIKSAFDDIESIYKRSNEVKSSIKSQDLAASRTEVQKFIEDRVAEKIDNIDIRELNKNVRVAREFIDDVAKNAGKFDTQSSASLGDYFVFGLGQQAVPGFGAGAFAIKKIVESSPIRMRLTKALSRGKKRVSETDIKAIQKEIADEIASQLNIKQPE